MAVTAGFAWVRAAHVGPIVAQFRRLDNPIAFSPTLLTRVLTTARVHAVSFGLLLWPSTLSADYSFDAVPAVTSAADAANVPAAMLYATLLAIGASLLRIIATTRSPRTAELSRACLGAYALLGLSYAPASHALLPLSFVVAERLLYIPSAAACLLLCGGLSLIRHYGNSAASPSRRSSFGWRWLQRCAVAAALVGGSVRTMRRNLEWYDDTALFTAAAAAYPRSAKAVVRGG